MDEIKIRNDGIYLNDKKIKSAQAYRVKSGKNGYAEVFIKLFVKLT
ncbi:hypothetical protein FMV2238Y02_02350 [Streptococcus canis]|uniref:Uncharacterized protein n=1 Tax=Streptococcus canis TaxID=1329 RepID=A0A3P5Y3I7_STRCB|nr:hypothetical protein [Streptococcus canis]VDC41792.1 hypothetical protein FMV2238Y02_02350 [Streptococcus canis]